MKHLHVQFILASIGLGFGVVLIMAALWNVVFVPLNAATPWRQTLIAWVSAGGGIVLVMFGYQGIRSELYGRKK